MMRTILTILFVCAFVITPIVAQNTSDCSIAPATRLQVGGQAAVGEGFTLNVRQSPGLNGEGIVRLRNKEIFKVVGGPECVDNLYWWQIQQGDLTGWVAEAVDGAYLIDPFLPIGASSPVPTLVSIGDLTLTNDLLAVIPGENPESLETDFITWDWEKFLSGSFYQPPDPLAIQIPDIYQGKDIPSGPFDLAQARFLNDAGLNDLQRAMLAQNGFVVVPANLPQFEDAYRFPDEWDPETGHPYWVTTDALLHALHVAFDNMLSFLEQEQLRSKLFIVVGSGYRNAQAQLEEALGTPGENVARGAAVYYAVAMGLLSRRGYEDAVTAEIRAEADPLIEAALNAQGRLPISFLPGLDEDFSQYKPRGHYADDPILQTYFRAMMWLGRITFLAKDDVALQTSLFVLRALAGTEAMNDWYDVADILTFLIGPTDNLGPTEYLPLAQEIFGEELPPDKLADPALLADFREQIKALPGPRINNVVRPIGTNVSELDDSTRGFRLFGQRFTFDSYVMQRLIYPYVGVAGNERALPSGLDVAAAMGSDAAYALLEAQGDTDFENYETNMASLRGEVNQISSTDWMQNIYGGWLWGLQPLWARDPKAYPPLMSTQAWMLRDLHAGLGSWTELKHDTLLYTAQPMGGLGGGGERMLTAYSLVEPNPLVFSRIAIVSAAIYQGLNERGLIGTDSGSNNLNIVSSAFNNLALLSANMAEMARKILAGETLTDDEQFFLKYNFGSELWQVRYLAELPLADPPKLAALVADVASNPDAGTVLQEATGGVDYIYVTTNSPDGLQIARGTVYSYYEFVNDIDNRLNDDEWRAQVSTGELPPRPNWVSAFLAP
jgi:Protein of unknown function (DUF3160)/Bacterial SH3 domain